MRWSIVIAALVLAPPTATPARAATDDPGTKPGLETSVDTIFAVKARDTLRPLDLGRGLELPVSSARRPARSQGERRDRQSILEGRDSRVRRRPPTDATEPAPPRPDLAPAIRIPVLRLTPPPALPIARLSQG